MSTRTICQIYTWGCKKPEEKIEKQLMHSASLAESRNGTIDPQVYAQDTIWMYYYFISFVCPCPNVFKFSALLTLHPGLGFFSFL